MFRDVGMNFIICMKDKYQPAVTSLKNCITISLTEKRNLQSDWLIKVHSDVLELDPQCVSYLCAWCDIF